MSKAAQPVNSDQGFASAIEALATAAARLERASSEFKLDMASIIGQPVGDPEYLALVQHAVDAAVRVLDNLTRDTFQLSQSVQQICAANRGRQRYTVSPETRAHMSTGQKQRFADPVENARHVEQLRNARARRTCYAKRAQGKGGAA